MSRPPSKLGRGLAALIPDEVVDSGRGEVRDSLRHIPLDRIQPNPEQPRMTFSGQALEQLAESIRAHGVITPLLVRRAESGDGYILIAGERRLRAAGLAGVEEVPCWVRENIGSTEQLLLALVENIQREDLDPVETAESYRRLVEDFGMTQAQVARRVGKDRATVANAIRLLRLPSFAIQELRGGTISAGHGKALLSLSEDDQIRVALREVLDKSLSVRATERLVSKMGQPAAPKKRAGPTPAMQRLGESLTKRLGAKVKVEPRGSKGKGRIVIEYFTPDEMDRLVQTLEAARA